MTMWIIPRKLMVARAKPPDHPFAVESGRSRISNLTAYRFGPLVAWWIG